VTAATILNPLANTTQSFITPTMAFPDLGPIVPLPTATDVAAGTGKCRQAQRITGRGRSRGSETSFGAARDFSSSRRFSRSKPRVNSCRTRWQARCSPGDIAWTGIASSDGAVAVRSL